LPVDTIIRNTKINASQRLFEKRSKPPKATSMQDHTEDKKTLSIHYKPLQLAELCPALDVEEPSSFVPPLFELQIPPNSPRM
jgi:hypothetical protein